MVGIVLGFMRSHFPICLAETPPSHLFTSLRRSFIFRSFTAYSAHSQLLTYYVTPLPSDSDDVTGRLAQLPSQLEELQQLRTDASEQLQDVLERRDAQILRQSQLMAQQLEMLLNLVRPCYRVQGGQREREGPVVEQAWGGGGEE